MPVRKRRTKEDIDMGWWKTIPLNRIVEVIPKKPIIVEIFAEQPPDKEKFLGVV